MARGMATRGGAYPCAVRESEEDGERCLELIGMLCGFFVCLFVCLSNIERGCRGLDNCLRFVTGKSASTLSVQL